MSKAYEERMDLKLLCSYMGHLEYEKPDYFSEQEYMLANLHVGVMAYVEILEWNMGGWLCDKPILGSNANSGVVAAEIVTDIYNKSVLQMVCIFLGSC